MTLPKTTYQTYCAILKEELLLSMGCTEPIAIAYAAAIIKQTLGAMPERVEAALSGNIIKNVKSVVVPATGGMHGISAAIAAGCVSGAADKQLQVLSVLKAEDISAITAFLEECKINTSEIDHGHIFDIQLTAYAGGNQAFVRIVDWHTNVVLVKKNDEILMRQEIKENINNQSDRSLLNVKDIVTFADEVDLKDVESMLEQQISHNMAIAEEGLKGTYGACIGKIIYRDGMVETKQKARAMAAAGSDARMNGCELPVCIISGSGNQGMTASIPVVVYANDLKVGREKMLRALLVSDLITIHQKTGIGRLSAYCGAISAGCGCGAGIAYLYGGGYEEIAHTVVNAVAILSGTICDGAKSSCAAKIAMAVEAGIMGYEMYQAGHQFYGGEGIVKKGVENTIENVGTLARVGMRDTDKEIIKIMLK